MKISLLPQRALDSSKRRAQLKLGRQILDRLLGDEPGTGTDAELSEKQKVSQYLYRKCGEFYTHLLAWRRAQTPKEKSSVIKQMAGEWKRLEPLLAHVDKAHMPMPLRSYVDCGFAAEVLHKIALHEPAKPFFSAPFMQGEPGTPPSEAEARSLYTALIEEDANLRSALLALGKSALDEGDVETAQDCANRSLHINAVCPDSQSLLFDTLKAKASAGEKVPETDLAMGDLSQKFCSRPFTTLVTGFSGGSFLCDCPAYLPFPSGNVLEDQNADDIWNSEKAQEIRRSILDGDFSYCSRSLCGLIKEDLLPNKDEVTDTYLRDIIDNHRVELPRGPKTVQLSHDQSCNLACPSCRTEIMTLKGSEQEPYMTSLDRVLLPLLEKTRGVVMVSGGGDPFGSKFYRSVLSSLNPDRFKDLNISILTNGLLLTPKQWSQFEDAHPMVNALLVSVDAAREETYADVRRPGNLNKLIKNLEFLSEKRKSGALKYFGLCFVVQQKNFREMPEFVALGKRLGVDAIWFQRIVNFGSFTSDEIKEADVAFSDHPDHAEFQTILKHPDLKDPIVQIFGEFLDNRKHDSESATLFNEELDRKRDLRDAALEAGDEEAYKKYDALVREAMREREHSAEFRLSV
ncbi:MAG: radical SAM protein [Pseudomonadota bacterium]